MHQANGLKLESAAARRLHMNFHELGNPGDVGVGHDPASAERADLDLPAMILDLS
jgi:hypothetical protein